MASNDFDLLDNRLSTLLATNGHGARFGTWEPAVSLQETPDGFTLTVEVPGMTRDEIAIEMENGTLTVRGTKRDAEGEDGRWHVRERAYGPFRRVFRLPRWVEADAVSADLENGVLSIRLPKAVAAQARRIQIGGQDKIA